MIDHTTDEEMVKLCAEAMGFEVYEDRGGLHHQTAPRDLSGGKRYDPLHDDAQAMALVKKFAVQTEKVGSNWHAVIEGGWYGMDESLNRAICECVAKMKETK